MNQKLRTARSGIVILFAILSIVCLSLSLALSAHFAAYAEGEDTSATLSAKDAKGNGLWQVHYIDSTTNSDTVSDLLDGKDADQNPLSYLGFDGSVMHGDKEVNYFAPYRGTNVVLSVKLNPNYEINGEKLSALYDLDNASYVELYEEAGGADSLTTMSTSVTVNSKTDGEAALSLTKDWIIAPICNEVLGSQDGYISRRVFADEANYKELSPKYGTDIVYDFKAVDGPYSQIIAIRRNGNVTTYLQASDLGGDYVIIENSSFGNDGTDLINDTIRHLDVGDYTLKVTAMAVGSEADSDIYYVSNSVTYAFNVQEQSITSEDNFKDRFGSIPDVHVDIEYPCNDADLANIYLKLAIGDFEMRYGQDYVLVLSSNNVGKQDLIIRGNGNLVGDFELKNAVTVTPASNRWATLPNISSWSYGDYDKTVNKIVGLPDYPSDLNENSIKDITFRIVSVDKDGVEKDIEGLTSIHYVIDDSNDTVQYLVSDNDAALLAALHAGNYRMYASVYGVNIGDPNVDRNYKPLSEQSIDFEVRVGTNSWDSENGVPNVVAWTQGKYDPETNIITAMDRYGNDALILIQIIKNGKPENVYSNHPEHANQDYGVYGKGEEYATKILKSLKAGYYTLRAEIKVEDNEFVDYNALNTLIDFTIARNGLPTWAVILIVVGSLAVVAVVFIILHEKGVLQMLTGKVIISMRTRANVDATIAAIRAAKVAREAEASIAAAKAREAEEAAKDKKD